MFKVKKQKSKQKNKQRKSKFDKMKMEMGMDDIEFSNSKKSSQRKISKKVKKNMNPPLHLKPENSGSLDIKDGQKTSSFKIENKNIKVVERGGEGELLEYQKIEKFVTTQEGHIHMNGFDIQPLELEYDENKDDFTRISDKKIENKNYKIKVHSDDQKHDSFSFLYEDDDNEAQQSDLNDLISNYQAGSPSLKKESFFDIFQEDLELQKEREKLKSKEMVRQPFDKSQFI